MKKIVLSLVCLMFVVCGVSVSAVLLSSYGSQIEAPGEQGTEGNYSMDWRVVIVSYDQDLNDNYIIMRDNYGNCSITAVDVDNSSNKQTSTTSFSISFNNQIRLSYTCSSMYTFEGWYEIDSIDYDATNSARIYDVSRDSTCTVGDGFSTGCAVFRMKQYKSATIKYYGGAARWNSIFSNTALKVSISSNAEIVSGTNPMSNNGTINIHGVIGQTVTISFTINYTGLGYVKIGSDPTSATGGGLVSSSRSYSTTWTVSTDTTMDVYVRQAYTLTFSPGAGSGSTQTSYKLHGTSITTPSLSGYTRTGYTATQWITGSTKYNAGAAYTANASATFTPNWKVIKYYVEFNGNGGTLNSGYSSNTISLTYDDNELPITLCGFDMYTRAGYRIVGWKFEGMDNCSHYFEVYGSDYRVYTTESSYSVNVPDIVNLVDCLMGVSNLRSTPGIVTMTALWELTTRTININFLFPDGSEGYANAGSANIVYSDGEGSGRASDQRSNNQMAPGQTVTISDITPGTGMTIAGVNCSGGFTLTSSGSGTYVFTLGQSDGDINITMMWNNTASVRLNWNVLPVNSSGSTVTSGGGTVTATYSRGSGTSIQEKTVSNISTSKTFSRNVTATTYTLTATPAENYIFLGFTTTNTAPTEIGSTTYTGSANTIYVWFKQTSNFKLKYDSTEGYYYYEDGLFPQTYAGDTLSSTLESVTASSTKYYYDLGTPWEESVHDGNGSGTYTLRRQYMYKNQITVSLWGYMDNWEDYGKGEGMRLISCTENGGWNIETNSNNIQFAVYDDGANTYRSLSGSTSWSSLASGWHMFTLTFDGSYARGYLDGAQIAMSTQFTGEIGYNAGNNIFVGAEAGGSLRDPYGCFFKGKIKKLNVLNMCLAANQIASLFSNGAGDTNNVEMKVVSYSGAQYAQAAVRKWFKLEPIRWRVNENLFLGEAGATNEGIVAVSADVIGFGAIYSGAKLVNDESKEWAFDQSSAYSNLNRISWGLSNTTNAQISNDYYTKDGGYPPTSSKPINFDAGKARYASAWEIESAITGTKAAKFSDLVAFIVTGGKFTSGGYCGTYFTRSLYPQRNVAYAYTGAGEGGEAYLNQCLGARLSVTLKDLTWEG